MFWSLILPLQLTVGIFVVLTVLATIAGPKFGASRTLVLFSSLLLSFLLFIPSCAVVVSIVDHYRFGVFKFADSTIMGDQRVQRLLPDAATDITIDKQMHGFRAKFKIDNESLDQWFNQHWDQFGGSSVSPRDRTQIEKLVDQDHFALRYADLGWTAPQRAIEYAGPVADNGAGFVILFDKERGVCYEQCGYW
jgi:hypothetical protein